MALETEYQYLEYRPGSNYRQPFVKGRRIRVEVLYRRTINREQLTVHEVAADYQLPVDAVLEAIEYCKRNPAVLDADRRREQDNIRREGLDKPPFVPSGLDPNP
jgi:uncharacterized protein (DUF433 family)